MNLKVQNNSKFDGVLWLVIVAIIAAGTVANFYYAAQPLALRLIAWLVLAGISLAIALQTGLGKAVWHFLREARMEMRKVVWPTRQETVQTTLIVVAMVILMALLLWGIDSALLWAIGTLTGQRG